MGPDADDREGCAGVDHHPVDPREGRTHRKDGQHSTGKTTGTVGGLHRSGLVLTERVAEKLAPCEEEETEEKNHADIHPGHQACHSIMKVGEFFVEDCRVVGGGKSVTQAGHSYRSVFLHLSMNANPVPDMSHPFRFIGEEGHEEWQG